MFKKSFHEIFLVAAVSYEKFSEGRINSLWFYYTFFLTYVIMKLLVGISTEQNMVKTNLHTYSAVSRYSILIKTFYIF